MDAVQEILHREENGAQPKQKSAPLTIRARVTAPVKPSQMDANTPWAIQMEIVRIRLTLSNPYMEKPTEWEADVCLEISSINDMSLTQREQAALNTSAQLMEKLRLFC